MTVEDKTADALAGAVGDEVGIGGKVLLLRMRNRSEANRNQQWTGHQKSGNHCTPI